jgi:hypothetical protein
MMNKVKKGPLETKEHNLEYAFGSTEADKYIQPMYHFVLNQLRYSKDLETKKAAKEIISKVLKHVDDYSNLKMIIDEYYHFGI